MNTLDKLKEIASDKESREEFERQVKQEPQPAEWYGCCDCTQDMRTGWDNCYKWMMAKLEDALK